MTERDSAPSTSTGRTATRGNRIALGVIAVGFLAVLAALIGGLAIGRSAEPIGEAGTAVQAACRSARDDLKAFGPIADDADAVALADRVDRETARLRAMVDEIRTADTGNAAGQAALNGWISDWDRLLDARDAASKKVRGGDIPDTWLPPAVDGKVEGIDGRMDEYARREILTACTTDILEADNLDGIRTYRDIEE